MAEVQTPLPPPCPPAATRLLCPDCPYAEPGRQEAGDVGAGAAPPPPPQSWSPAAPHPSRRSRPAGPQVAPKLHRTRRCPRPPYLRPGRGSLLRPRSLRVAPGPAETSRPARPAPPHPAPAANPGPRGTRSGSRAATRTPQGKLRPGAGSVPRNLRSLTPQRALEASAANRVPPTPTRTHRSWQQERPRVRHGAGLRGALRPPTQAHQRRGRASAGYSLLLATPGAPPAVSPLPLPQSPPRAHSPASRARDPLALPAAPATLDGAVAGDTGGTARAGQGRAAARRSRGWRRRCAAD